MFLVIISSIFACGALAGICFIVGRRLTLLGSIDITALPFERDAAVKERIMTQRIKRKFSSMMRFLGIVLQPLFFVFTAIRRAGSRLYVWFLAARAAHRKSMVVGGAFAESDQSSSTVLARAERAFLDKRNDEAEQAYISLLAKDPKSLDAYRGLTALYSSQKEWEKAAQTGMCMCALLDKARKQDEAHDTGGDTEYAECAFQTSQFFLEAERLEKALSILKKALAVQANNPRYVDALVVLFIALGKRLKAEEALDHLRSVNPENKKIEEFEQKIQELSY